MPRDYSLTYRERWLETNLDEFAENLCPNRECLTLAARQLSSTILAAHGLNAGLWGLSRRDDYLRLNFGNMEALVWAPDALSVMVDVPTLRRTGTYGRLAQYLEGLLGAYATARQSDYILLPTENPRELARLLSLAADGHARHLKVASTSRINGRTRASHHPGMIDAVGRLAGVALPQPTYVTIARPHSTPRTDPGRSPVPANEWSEEGDPFSDIEDAASELAGLSETERTAIVRARIGQGPFRKELERYWRTCAVTGTATRAALRASHIKPWRKSDNSERLDPFNGLLLIANLDALFDKGLITFSASGELLCSRAVPIAERPRLGLSRGMRLRKVDRLHKSYLAYHRKDVFRD